MIFKHTWQRVMSGRKTQTRRLVTENETDNKTLDYDALEWGSISRMPAKEISVVYTGVYAAVLRAKWQVGKTYAVQPGRGKKQVGRIRLTGIRREDVREISWADADAEGYHSPAAFLGVWTMMHDPKANAALTDMLDIDDPMGPDFYEREMRYWARNILPSRPAHLYDAWVLEFELADK